MFLTTDEFWLMTWFLHLVEWHNAPIISSLSIELDRDCKLYVNGTVVAEDIITMRATWTAVIKGYILVLLNADAGGNNILVVVDEEDSHVVGSISNKYGVISSPELSRLIMTTPEIDWEV